MAKGTTGFLLGYYPNLTPSRHRAALAAHVSPPQKNKSSPQWEQKTPFSDAYHDKNTFCQWEWPENQQTVA